MNTEVYIHTNNTDFYLHSFHSFRILYHILENSKGGTEFIKAFRSMQQRLSEYNVYR